MYSHKPTTILNIAFKCASLIFVKQCESSIQENHSVKVTQIFFIKLFGIFSLNNIKVVFLTKLFNSRNSCIDRLMSKTGGFGEYKYRFLLFNHPLFTVHLGLPLCASNHH